MTQQGVNFSRAYEELERIVESFETGNVDLERDLPKFERGLELAVACRKRLQEIENHIRKIEKTFRDISEPRGKRLSPEENADKGL